MDHDGSWEGVVARLRAARTLRVTQFEPGGPVTGDDIDVIKLMEKSPPPPMIMNYYSSCNGVKLLWDGKLGELPVQGSVNIVSILESTLRAPAQEDGEPLEGILWTEEFDPGVLRDLKRMAVFEALAGRSAYLTYRIDAADSRLFLVENDRVRPLAPDFDTIIELLKRYAGAESLREHLTQQDWQERINADDRLRRLAAL